MVNKDIVDMYARSRPQISRQPQPGLAPPTVNAGVVT